VYLPESFRPPNRPLLALLILAFSWWAIDRGIAALIGREVLQSQFRFSCLYRGDCDANVLILGNSRGVNGFFSPDLTAALGKKVFNLSYNGLSIKMARMLFEDYVSRCPAPELLILEVTNALDAGTSVGLCQLYADKSPVLANAWRTAEPTAFWLSRLAAATFRYNGELPLRAVAFRKRSDQNWINTYQMPEGMMARYVVAPEAAAKWETLDPEAIAELCRCITTARTHGTKVMLVITPYAPGYRAQLPGFTDWVQGLEAATGEDVRDLSEAIITPKYFGDPLHMNLEGARALMPEVLALVREEVRDQAVACDEAGSQTSR